MKRIPVLILLLAFTSAAAQPTLQECRALAREHYPQIRQYNLVEQTKEYSLSNASKAFLPRIVLGAQATWQTDVASFPEQMNGMLSVYGLDIPGIRKDQYQVSVQVDQTLWDGGKTRADKAIAKAQAAVENESLDVDMYEFEKRIDDLYFGILMLDNRIGQTERLIESLNGNLDQARALVKGGAAMQADADALEAETLLAGQNLVQLESVRDSYRRVLEIFIGQSLGEGTLPEPPMPSLQTDAIRPELRLLDARISAATAKEALVKSSVMPRLSLFAQGWYGYPGLDMFQSMTSSAWTWNAIIGVKMNWNITAFYTKGNDLRKIQVEKASAEVQKDLFTFNNSLRNVQRNADVERLQSALDEDSRIAELRRRVRIAAESRFRSGVISTTELLKAVTDEATAELARSGHELELLKTVYELKHDSL